MTSPTSPPPAPPAAARLRRVVARWALALFMVVAGLNHFLNPAPYLGMMPDWLPAHALLVAVSGIAEVAGGLGLLLPRTRGLASWGLVALLVAVFPANLHMALHDLPLGGHHVPTWALWARLPLQPVMMWWAWAVGRPAAG